MLKILSTPNLINQNKTKCGEIYCDDYLELTIYCTFCDIKLFTYDDFLQHLQNVHFDTLTQTEAVEEDCKQTLKDEVDVELLQENDAEDEVGEIEYLSDNNFEIVDNDYSSSEEEESLCVIKKSEKDNVINQNTEFLCNINTEPLSSNSNDNKTTKNIKAAEWFNCPDCDEKYPYKKDLDSHVKDMHKGYKCTLCDKRFGLRHHLKRHINTHTAEKKFPCTVDYCGRFFRNEENLKHHLEIHTLEKTFICDYENCGKAFQTQRRLSTHKYYHTQTYPKNLVCDTCGYTCRAMMTLEIHQRRHTGEKPFICGVCQKGFVSKTALNTHMVSHSETRPHVCKICNATFANIRILQRHVLIHSDERRYKCKYCDSAFKQVHGLDGHVRRIHKPPKLLENDYNKMKEIFQT